MVLGTSQANDKRVAFCAIFFIIIKQYRQYTCQIIWYTCNLTLRRVRVTIIGLEKQ